MVKKKDKIRDFLVFEEDGQEFKLLTTEMSLRRSSEGEVKMQDRLVMNPTTLIFRGRLSGKAKDKGNR